jgi:DNA helicase-2/ATP-dependent DNA helicase PcrA
MENQKNDKAAKWKYKNIEMFTSSIEDWERNEANMNPGLYNYLNRISLVGRSDDEEENFRGKVNLMTIHAAKGLDFDVMFLPVVKETIVPHARALEEAKTNIEEERRIFYVAITHTRKKLFITARKIRKVVDISPSPFLGEIPRELIVYHKAERPVTREEETNFFAAMKEKFKA